MKLQSKITLGLLPLILLSLYSLGAWSIKTAADGIRESQFEHLSITVEAFFENELERTVTILKKNKLHTVDSFVEAYQKTVTENAQKKFTGEKQYLVILAETGEVIFGNVPSLETIALQDKFRPYLEKILSASGTELRGQIDADANNFNFIGKHFPPWRWYVFISSSDEATHKSISKLKKATFGIAAFLAVSSLLLISLLFRLFLVQPIKQLKTVAKTIAARQKIEPFTLSRNDELGDLAQSLDIMSKDVYAYQASLIAGKENLKKEIHNRTLELEQEKKLAQEYLNVAGVMLVALDDKGLITMINQKGCQLLEVSEAETLGKSWFDHFLPKQNIDEVTAVFNKLMTGQIELVEHYENPVITSTGQLLTVSFHNAIIKNNNGEVKGILFSGEDTTARRQMEEALQESEERFRLMMHQSPSVIELYDADGLQIEVNQAYEKLWGFPASHTVNKFNLLKSKEVEATGLINYVQRAYAGETVDVPEYKFDSRGETEAHGAGRLRWLTTRIYPIKDVKGNVKNIVINHEDITEARYAEKENQKLESRLKHAQKMEAIGTLAGGIAHDFNNILGIILGYTGMAIEDAPAGTKYHEDLARVATAANRAKELVKQILAFSRQTQVARMPLRIQPIIKEGLKMLRSSIPSTISITEKIAHESGTTLADPTQVHQILVNLCTNAYHAMEANGGELAVTLKTTFIDADNQTMLIHVNPGEYIELTVSDTGTGIGPDIIDKIFDPYFTTKEIGKGTGMGLAIIHGIMKEYGGAITVESRLGKGSTFHAYFPVSEEEAMPETEEKEYLPKGTERILFIDDEELLAEMGKDMLERQGYHVTVRRSSLEALTTFQDTPNEFDLVITDQTMPEMTGTDLARRMMQVRPDIPIVLCTGYSNLVDEDSAKDMGIREFALKPLTKAAITGLIRKVLDG